jgi:hypothetical protein
MHAYHGLNSRTCAEASAPMSSSTIQTQQQLHIYTLLAALVTCEGWQHAVRNN